MKLYFKLLGIFAIFICMGLGISFVGKTLGWFGSAMDTVSREVAPDELLRKYTWFKDASAVLNKKQADIKNYEQRIAVLSETPRDKMDRTDKETMNQWQTELIGVKGSYNLLAAEYNSNMAKINWSFTNIGSLPKGATEPLQREFAEYR